MAGGEASFRLGWHGSTPRGDPTVRETRERLRRHNGLAGVELVPAADVARAAETFHRDGFVAVAGALQGGALLRMQAAAQRMCERIIALHTDNEWGARTRPGAGQQRRTRRR